MFNRIKTRGGNVPSTFSLFLEDLELFLQDDVNSGISFDEVAFILMLFGDDMVIFGKNTSDLQKNLDLLFTYCSTWGLEVNPDKSKIVVFRKRGPLKHDEKWTYNNMHIEVVSNFNYLGTVFNYTGNFNLNQETLTGKGLKALNILLANTKGMSLKPSTLCQLFDAFVGSVLNYASEIWGFSKSKDIERIHLKFCKSILYVKQSTSTMAIYGELCRYPLFINRYVRIVKYWLKIVNSENIIVKKMYEIMLNDCQRGKVNWVSKVKSLLENNGFLYVWNNPDIINIKTFPLLFKQRLTDQFVQAWTATLSVSSSLCTYKLFKNSFKFEYYLDNIPLKLRIPLTKLRLSSHQLRIETGRYGNNRTERNQRHCMICNSGDLEDEYHFICICSAYNQIRKRYINKFYFYRPSVVKFIELMQSVNYSVVIKLCKFIREAFIIRQNIVNNYT